MDAMPFARFCRTKRFLHREEGNALIELVLALGLIGVPLLLATVYTGLLLYDSLEVSNAAHAAALYGMQSSTYASDSAGITTAAQNEAPDLGAALTVNPVTFYACSNAIDGTHYSAQSDASTACTGSAHALEFIQVTASYAATPFVQMPFTQIPGIQRTVALSSVSVMEVEE